MEIFEREDIGLRRQMGLSCILIHPPFGFYHDTINFDLQIISVVTLEDSGRFKRNIKLDLVSSQVRAFWLLQPVTQVR